MRRMGSRAAHARRRRPAVWPPSLARALPLALPLPLPLPRARFPPKISPAIGRGIAPFRPRPRRLFYFFCIFDTHFFFAARTGPGRPLPDRVKASVDLGLSR